MSNVSPGTPYSSWPVRPPPECSVLAFARWECPECGATLSTSAGYMICHCCQVQFDLLHQAVYERSEMITEDDRRELSDVVLRALDAIVEEFGDDALLLGATLVAEIRVGGESEEEALYHHRYWSMPRVSPSHALGMLTMSAGEIVSTREEE